MTSVKLTDGSVMHLPGMPFITDSTSTIEAPSDEEMASVVPLIPHDELLLFTVRIVRGARKRRRQARWAKVNAARLRMARMCIDQALSNWQAVQTTGQDEQEAPR